MAWNYRVVHQEVKCNGNTEHLYGMHEVYYDKRGNTTAFTVAPMDPHGNTVKELKTDLEAMLEGLNKPVLEITELEKLVEDK